MAVNVKICGITSETDGLVAAEAGANAIGLMFWEQSPRYVTLEQAARISRALPPFVLRTGVFVDPPEDLVVHAIAACGLNLLQFHGNETPEFCLQFGLMTMKAFRVRDAASLEALPQYATDAWLLDAYSARLPGGTGEQFDWDLAIQNPENVGEAVRRVQPFGVDVSSGVETSPGRKDPARVRAFIQAAKQAGD